jgi:MOSC domain-containing protein YiiM
VTVAQIVSIQVGRPAEIPYRGGTVRTAIVKTVVPGPVYADEDGFADDEQADLTVHGGPDKAICVYAVEYRPLWKEMLGVDLPGGAFGENLSVRGVLEPDVNIGDIVRVGGATVQVSQPRGPCYKVAARWGRKELPDAMAKAGISGWYYRVLEPGAVDVGDEIELLERRSGTSVAEVMRVTYSDRHDEAAQLAVLAVPELAAMWRDGLARLVARRAAAAG